MAKILLNSLTTLRSNSALIQLNSHLDLIEAALENTLSRDGTNPNTMESDLDLNSNRIFNLPAPLSDHEPARHGDIVGYVEATENAADIATAAADAAETFADEAQASAEAAAQAAADIGMGIVGNLPAGGTTGQFLKKDSGTNYDASWLTPTFLDKAITTDQTLSGRLNAPAFIGAYDGYRISHFITSADGIPTHANIVAAWQALMSNDNQKRHLDCEGKFLTLEAPLTAAGFSKDHKRSINNFSMSIDEASFPLNGYAFDLSTVTLMRHFTIDNSEFDGKGHANFFMQGGNYLNTHIHNCRLAKPKTILISDSASSFGGKFKVTNCRLQGGEAPINPLLRTTVGLEVVNGDNLVSEVVFEQFGTGYIQRNGTGMLNAIHVFQGGYDDVQDTPNVIEQFTKFSPGLRFTVGTHGTTITGLYLDKCYILLTNEDEPDAGPEEARVANSIGGLFINGIKGLCNNTDGTFAFLHAKNYSDKGPALLSRITVANGEFSNSGSNCSLTKEQAGANGFGLNNGECYGINFDSRTVVYSKVAREYNPYPFTATFSSTTNHLVSTADKFPWNLKPKGMFGITPVDTVNIDSFWQGAVDGNARTINIKTQTAVAGTFRGEMYCDNDRFI